MTDRVYSTNKQLVQARYPKARCYPPKDDGIYWLVIDSGPTPPQTIGIGETPPKAWDDAYRRILKKGKQ